MLSQREIVLASATVVSISCGLNYLFSAYAPQLANQLGLSSTSTNLVGAAGNLGVYLSSPIIGRIVDRQGPKPTLLFAAVALTSGYLLIRAFYVGGDADGSLFAKLGVPGLALAELLTGIGSTAGLSSAGNTVAKSYKKKRAAALSVVLSGFGLSAFFYSTLSSALLHSVDTDRDTTPSFLLLLAIGCLISMSLGVLLVKPVANSSPVDALHETATDSSVHVPAVDADAEADVVVEPTATERTPLVNIKARKDEINVSGLALFRELDFYLIFLFNGLCAGVGLCYINNIGTVIRSLSLASDSAHPLPSPHSIALTQSRLVSLLSIFNFLGRLCSGFGSDYFVHHKIEGRRVHRVWWLVWTSSFYTLSQVFAMHATRIEGWKGLVLPTILTGFAHGSLFGISGVIGLERFGLKNFSGTNGLLALAPALFGQSTNLIFGRIYDSHSHSHSRDSAPSRLAVPSSSPTTCTLGRACYLDAFRLTTAMAAGAVVVALVLATGRKSMKIRAA
ncbi:hypothetical protein JCM1841_005422 [Sporobolomyces salmonicolor]